MAKVIGLKHVSYTRKTDGKEVRGLEIVTSFPSKYYEGVDVAKDYIGLSVLENMQGIIPQVGDEIEYTYGRAFDGRAYVNGWRIIE